jgi:DUF3093 family protein
MRGYRERLWVPLSWWLVVTGCVLLFSTMLWAGLTPATAVIIYAGLEAACALALLGWGAAIIEVTESDLRAGRLRMPLASVADVTPLDAGQARALRGPRADPAACLLLRPYLQAAVYVEVAGRPPERPYWLIATRHPAELAAAIRSAAPARRAGGSPVTRPAPAACDDSAGDRAAEPTRPATETALSRRDGNA